jgi:hypothetical protein
MSDIEILTLIAQGGDLAADMAQQALTIIESAQDLGFEPLFVSGDLWDLAKSLDSLDMDPVSRADLVTAILGAADLI